MPMYDYQCDSCGNTVTELRKMADRDHEASCACGSVARRAMSVPRCHADNYLRPVVSEAMAVTPKEVGAARKKFPYMQFRDDGCPVITSYEQHEKFLTDTGYIKL